MRALPLARTVLALTVLALTVPAFTVLAGAQPLSNPAGPGYGRHALAPPRHELRPPRHRGADGAPVPSLETDLRPPARGQRLRGGLQSRSARHASWCRARYRSYDPRADTFVPRAGAAPVRCASPFRR